MNKRALTKTLCMLMAGIIAAAIFAGISPAGAALADTDDNYSDRYDIELDGLESDGIEKDDMSLDEDEDDEYVYDAAFEAEIAQFPESYKTALRRLHVQYPNFTFVADFVEMSLDTAVNLQIEHSYKTYNNVYTTDYDTIRKYMDPMTYLYPAYDSNYFSYSSFKDRYVNVDALVFADYQYMGSESGGALQYLVDGVDYLETENMDSIIAVSAMYNMSPYFLASLSIVEKGSHAILNGNLDVTGRVVNIGTATGNIYPTASEGYEIAAIVKDEPVYIVDSYKNDNWYMLCYNGLPAYIKKECVQNVTYYNTYYNLFSINQSDGNVVCGGISYAMSHGWTSRATSFEGGANFCKTYYYNNGQNTLYYMQFNVMNPVSNIWHQYSSALNAALSSARWLGYAYEYNRYQPLVLHIPVYESEDPVQKRNGVWTYIGSDGEPDYTYNGLGYNENGLWYIKDGLVDFSVTGLRNVDGIWYYFVNGELRTDYTGMAVNEYGTWYVENGVVTLSRSGIVWGTVADVTDWWYVKNSQVIYADTVASNEYGWWRIKDGRVDFSFTGLAANEYGWWYIRDGQVRFDYTGYADNEYGCWRVLNGKVDFDCNTVELGGDVWWYCRGGQVQFNYWGVAPNGYGWWRIEAGTVNFSYTGLASNEYGTWYIENGQVNFGFTGSCDGHTIINGQAVS